MKLAKTNFEFCIQACINSYRGEYGKVVEIFDKKIDYDIGKVEWTVGIKENTMYLVFRGSDGKADWFDNLQYKQISYIYQQNKNLKHNIKLHEGFYKDQYLLAKAQIFKSLNDMFLETKITQIIITGHSLGAALAIIGAFDLFQSIKGTFIKEIACIAYAAPRQGNKSFIKAFKKTNIPLYLFRYKNDTVTQVPPKIILGYNNIKLFKKFNLIFPTHFIFYKDIIKPIKLGKSKWYEFILRKATNPLDHYPNLYKEGLKSKIL